jgi:methionine sulfoxide reductase heme-binding subunit
MRMSVWTQDRLVRSAKPLVFLLCLLPLAVLAWAAVTDGLGANPVEALIHGTGDWALRFLLLTLAMTPLKRLLGQPWPIRFRRMLGLFAFFYACLHLLTYAWIDQGFDWPGILQDVVKRPYITVGLAAFLLLVPLAVTSTRAMVRRLGRRWKSLHRAVYAIGVLAVVHFLWLVKADLLEPGIYALILVILLLARVPFGRIELVGRWLRGLAGPQRERA